MFFGRSFEVYIFHHHTEVLPENWQLSWSFNTPRQELYIPEHLKLFRDLPDNEHYGYRPVLLETFVQLPRFTGTAYRAANWRYVGLTKGRGKLEKLHQVILPQKAIFLYPLRPDFKEILTR